MNSDERKSKVVSWLKGVTNLTTIKDRPGIARPPTPYLMVEDGPYTELSDNKADENYTESDAEVTVNPVIEFEQVYLVYAYGEIGKDVLERVKQAAYLPQILEPLRSVGLDVFETGAVNSIPEFIDQKWERRYQMNLSVRGVTGEGEGFAIDTIEQHEPFDIQRV